MEIKIIPYSKSHHEAFRQLNLEWLNHYNLAEPYDLEILDDPEKMILQKGGFIWMAEAEGKLVGSAALIKEHDDEYELAKMAVTDAFRGKGISKMLIETCLQKARELNAKKMLLFSNHQLTTALALYEKYGFRHVVPHNSPFETADVRMELVL